MATDSIRLADSLARRLETVLRPVPDRFLDSFEYTSTGNNLVHPVVLGCLCKAAWELPSVQFVGVDVRLNLGGGVKFQPDFVAFGRQFQKPLWFLDYESPNSSDARVVFKDVDAYLKWCEKSGAAAPYIIITTLPDCESPSWELRWTAKDCYNEAFRGRRPDVRQNPYHFWYDYYESEFRSRDIANIALLNINGRQVTRVLPKPV